jgi:hypothetical protein
LIIGVIPATPQPKNKCYYGLYWSWSFRDCVAQSTDIAVFKATMDFLTTEFHQSVIGKRVDGDDAGRVTSSNLSMFF